ncbi:MAG: CBU_0585 family protein [Gammaproteobacteria bacterium]
MGRHKFISECIMTFGYVSPIDQYLEEFDKTHPLTESQRAEIKKYQWIDDLRDHPHPEMSENELWEAF